MFSRDRRVDYFLFEEKDGSLKFERAETVSKSPGRIDPEKLRGSGYVTYKKPGYFRRWRVDGEAGINLAEGFERSPLRVQLIADERMRPDRWS